jgi:putative hemolysin
MDAASGSVVGTYRLLPGVLAENSIGYYSETEFDLSGIRSIPGSKLELGRSCVHRDFRNATVITLLWRGIASYVERYDIGFLFGCGSLHTSNAAEVSMVYSYLNRFHRAEERFQVRPLTKLKDVSMFPFCDKEQAYAALPPLMKGYLRLGAQICGEPAYDPLFETTDFFVLLDSRKLLDRYRIRFLSGTSGQVCAA